MLNNNHSLTNSLFLSFQHLQMKYKLHEMKNKYNQLFAKQSSSWRMISQCQTVVILKNDFSMSNSRHLEEWFLNAKQSSCWRMISQCQTVVILKNDFSMSNSRHVEEWFLNVKQSSCWRMISKCQTVVILKHDFSNIIFSSKLRRSLGTKCLV
jgi:Fe-S cluster biosynthesis and repair protein YggX